VGFMNIRSGENPHFHKIRDVLLPQ
jgi:hypothetical protein